MKQVLILLTEEHDPTGKQFFKDAKYQHCYEYLYEMAEQHGVKLLRAPSTWYDHDRQVFRQAWTYENQQWTLVDDIRPDLIYDKTKFDYETHLLKEQLKSYFSIINDTDFTLLLSNKLFSSIIFSQFAKPYFKVTDQASLQAILERMPGEMVVLKPMVGSGGRGVEITTKEAADYYQVNGPVLVQEFVDSSRGIDGIVTGMHDLRLVFINNELIYSYIRQPKEGSYLANIAQGGTMTIVTKDELPPSVFDLVAYVQDKLSAFPQRIFTIDLIFDQDQRPWIVELNSMPGLYFTPDQKEWQDRFYQAMLTVFRSALSA